MDKWFLRRSGHVFCPPRLWVEPVDKQPRLWTARRCAHAMHRTGPVLPSTVPRNTQVLPSPTHHVGVTRFTPTGEWSCRVAEQWTELWRSHPDVGTTAPILWAAGGQPRGRPCGRFGRPQSVDQGCPQIHTPPSWPDESPTVPAVDEFWTTRASPGCGRGNPGCCCGETFLCPARCRRVRTKRSAPGVGPGALRTRGGRRNGRREAGTGLWRGLPRATGTPRRGLGRTCPALGRGPGRGQLLMRLVSSVTWL